MGTNFYWLAEPSPECPTCHQRPVETERRHIGKSSAGWCFSLHVYLDGEGPADLDQWRERFARVGSAIVTTRAP